LSDAQVESIRQWHDSGLLGYKAIAVWCFREWGMVVPKRTLRSIVNYDRR
jgi:hypothetical protein